MAGMLALGCNGNGDDDDGAGTETRTTSGGTSTGGSGDAGDGGSTIGTTDDGGEGSGADTGGPESGGSSDEGDSEAGSSGDTGEPIGTPLWVGVGNWGYRSASADGQAWQTVQNRSTGNDHSPDLLRGIGWGNGWFVACGGDANSMFMRSADGVTWEEDLHPGGTQWVGDVAWGDGRWVAVGGVGRVQYSDDDGATWVDNDQTLPAAGRSVAFGGGQFVAVGDGGMIAVSTDGESWDDHTQAGAVTLGSVAFGASTWVAAGESWNGMGFDTNCYVSSDGATWSSCPFTSPRMAGAYANEGTLVVVVEDGYESTTDGSAWAHVGVAVPSHAYVGDDLWVGAAGDRRYAGDSLDTLSETKVGERGFRDFTLGWVAR